MANRAVEGSAIHEKAMTVAVGWVNKRTTVALLLLIGLLVAAYLLHITPGRGAAASFSLLTGMALGLLFERGRFCFYCILRDYIQGGNSGPLYAILAALAVGGIGYAIVFGAFLPNAVSGRLPPGAHIGPVSWPLALAGLLFGLGMALSGACLSGHLYRLGQGYTRAPFALLGSLIGFGIGFYTWNTLYVTAIVRAPILWLPAWLGYGGALVLHLGVLGLLALLLLRQLPAIPAQPAQVLTVARVGELLFRERWHPALTGALVGLVGVFAYLRVEPLGVTAQLGSLTRTVLATTKQLPERLNGLDTLAGCATQVVQTVTENGLLISGLILAALAAALVGNRFQRTPLTFRGSTTALLGGVLMGWGAMTALGCTVGTLLSGISAFALSGWLFAIMVYSGVWLGIKLRLPQD
ncbi:MAG: YeeE/YedE family protein [Caldilineaceae bacterium]